MTSNTQQKHKYLHTILACLFIINGCPTIVISRSVLSDITTTLEGCNGPKMQGNNDNNPPLRSPNDSCSIGL
jgi:hypothetical protein